MGSTPDHATIVNHSVIDWKPLLTSYTPAISYSYMLIVRDTDIHTETHTHMGEAIVGFPTISVWDSPYTCIYGLPIHVRAACTYFCPYMYGQNTYMGQNNNINNNKMEK